MATYTSNLNLKKPASGDNVDIADINGNMDTIDTAVAGKIDTAGTGLSKSGTTLNHSNSVTANTTGVGSATAVPVIKYDAQGHVTSITTATIYPPTTAGTSGQYWKSDGSGAGAWQTMDTAPTASSANAVTSGGVKTALDAKIDTAGTKMSKSGTTLNHSTTSRTDTTSTAAPAHSGTFTAVDSVTTDTTGHVTAINVKTVTLPSDNNTDTKVRQTLQTGNYNLPLLLSYQVNTNTTANIDNVCYRNNSIYANTSTGKITASGFVGPLTGNADTATKVGTSTVGSSTQPIYLNAGAPTAVTVDNTTTAGSLMNLTTWAASTNLVTRNTIANWDGRYQTTSNKSNLAYCNKGAFGTAVTHNFNTATITVGTSGGTVTVTGMTASATVWVTPAPASHDVWCASGCRCTAQASNSLTFTVSKTASSNMTVNVVWM